MNDEPVTADRSRALDRIERLGNALPDPVFIFVTLIAILVGVSIAAAGAGWSAVNPVTGEENVAQSLVSAQNLARFFVEMPETFTRFPPLGLVLVVMLGAAIAEQSGLFNALIGRSVRNLPIRFLTPLVFVIGVMSHHASDAAYVVLIPLSAYVYHKAGRHPLAGVAAAYAGISGAFAGNYVPGQFDVLMLGITTAAARLIDPSYMLNPLGNWWFTATIGLVFAPIAWFVTDRIVEPRLRRTPVDGEAAAIMEPVTEDEAAQRRGLRHAGIAALVVVGVFAALATWPGFSPLIDAQTSGPQRFAPLFQALIAGFFLLFLATGWAYGRAVGSVRSHRDIVRMMGGGMRSMAAYLVLIFFAAHFVAMFGWSNLGAVISINGAEGLRELALPRPLLLVLLLLMSAGFDLFIGSASAKWSAMAPIVVPMLMMLGISPEMTTAAYRMGDSIFNIVTPLASNFPLVLILCQRWQRDFGVGSVITMMLPYSIAFGIAGLSLVAIWVGFGLPVGPAAPLEYVLPGARA